MSTLILELSGLLCTYKKMMLLILILSEKNIFQNKLKHLLVIKTNIFRIQAYDSIMCRYFCLGFMNFMLAGKTLNEFTNLLPNNFKRNDDIFYNKCLKND